MLSFHGFLIGIDHITVIVPLGKVVWIIIRALTEQPEAEMSKIWPTR